MSGSARQPPVRSGPARPNLTREPTGQRVPHRAQLPLLDRLIDEAPEAANDPSLGPGEATTVLRDSVRRDIEALLNARRRWRTWQPSLKELALSPLNYGIPDCAGAEFHGAAQRELLRREIEDTLRRFEPRFRTVRVILTTPDQGKEATLRLRIDALLHAEPAPEPIVFDTTVDPATADVFVLTRDDG
jgi:type VI secretion system protein ImpF